MAFTDFPLNSRPAATNAQGQATSATPSPERSSAAQTSSDNRDRILAISLGSVLGVVLLLLLCLGTWLFSRWWRQRTPKQARQTLPDSEALGETLPRTSTEMLMRESNETSGFDRRWSLLGARKARFSIINVVPPEPPPRSKARPIQPGPPTTHGGLWDASMISNGAASEPVRWPQVQPRYSLSPGPNTANHLITDSVQQPERFHTDGSDTEAPEPTNLAGLEPPTFPRSGSTQKRLCRPRARSISIGEPGRIHYPSEEELSQFHFGITLPTASAGSVGQLLHQPEIGESFSGNFVDFLEIHHRAPQV